MWVTTPFGGKSNNSFTEASYQIFTLVFIIVAKLQLGSSIENNFMIGVTKTRGTVLRNHSIGKVENQCSMLS